ncbi:MAG TPA: hypothetical protein VF081_00650 [Solirubrobacterales bacterium]
MAAVAAIAGLGALFLLGGGLSAQGTVSWRALGQESEAKSETTSKKQKKTHNKKPSKGQGKDDRGGSDNGHGHKKKPPPHKQKHYHQWNPCAEGGAAAQEYCEPADDTSPGDLTDPVEAPKSDEGA